jgi:hypothetical protein
MQCPMAMTVEMNLISAEEPRRGLVLEADLNTIVRLIWAERQIPLILT